MDYKKELIKRVIFIMKNSMYLIEPMNKYNLLNLYMKLEKNNNMLLKELELLLLGDEIIEQSPLYKVFLNRQNNKEYLINLKENKDNMMDCFTLLSIIRKFILREKINSNEKLKKIEAIDEFFRIIRYQNNGYIYTSGAILTANDIKNHIDIKSGVISNGVYDEEKINGSYIHNSEFINFILNDENHYKDNLSILTEEEKKMIYLQIHNIKKWNITSRCENKDTFFGNKFCNNETIVYEEDLFYYNNYFYMICPNCCSIFLVDKDKIPSDIQKRIINDFTNNNTYYTDVLSKRKKLLIEKRKY